MFELTAMAAGLVALFAFFDYVMYFVLKLTTTTRFLFGLVMLFVLYYVFSGPYTKDVVLPIARLVKEDLTSETKGERALDFVGFSIVLFMSYIIHWTMYARATGRSGSFGLTTGALIGLLALA